MSSSSSSFKVGGSATSHKVVAGGEYNPFGPGAEATGGRRRRRKSTSKGSRRKRRSSKSRKRR